MSQNNKSKRIRLNKKREYTAKIMYALVLVILGIKSGLSGAITTKSATILVL